MNRATIILITLLILSIESVAQKVKYKDLHVLLNAKKYDQAEPFLRTFLNDSKNSDHPSANLNMGYIFEEKSKANDILEETEELKANIDSAIIFYDKSYSLITEKEIKKNEEYYQAFNRRDLRTGKFGVKISDVQLDIETRIKDLRNTLNNASSLKIYFLKTQNFYNEADSIYANLANRFTSYNDLLLISKDPEVEQFGKLSSLFDSTEISFNRYRKVLDIIQNPGYNQKMELLTIENFNTDFEQKPDWSNDQVKVWDYRKWSAETFKIIQNEIVPLKQNILAYDVELNELRKNMLSDSTSSINEISFLVDKMVTEDLLKYDNNPLPLNIFNLKIKELEYISESINIVHKKLLDSSNVLYQIQLSEDMKRLASTGDLLGNSLITLNYTIESSKYSQFINDSYGSPGGAQRFVSEKALFFRNEKQRWETTAADWRNRETYIKYYSDVIPLINNIEVPTDYSMKWVSDSVRKEQVLSAGIFSRPDSLYGYFLHADASRSLDSLMMFDLASAFDLNSGDNITVHAQSDRSNNYFLVYSGEMQDNIIKSYVAKVSNFKQLVWHKIFELETEPALVLINDENHLVIYYEPYGAEVEGEESVQKSSLVIDTNGNIVEEEN